MEDSTSIGAAVDVGTTNIMARLIDLDTGEIISTTRAYNPQNTIGLDVITRARYYTKTSDNARKLRKLVLEKIDSLLSQLLIDTELSMKSLERIVFVGNTVMHHILFDLPINSLLHPPYSTSHRDEIDTTSMKLGLRMVPDVPVYSPPLIKSFIGSDAVSNIIHVINSFADYPLLLLDVGTNTELVLITRERIWATSAPSGPAFEGMSLQCGMPALEGAIDKVEITSPLEKPRVHVIGNTAPAGICGTGALSVLAELQRSCLMNEVGSFNRESQSKWLQRDGNVMHYLLVTENNSAIRRPIYISQVDIRMLQQSKAAIATSIMMLLQSARVSLKQIARVIFTGAFGTNLNFKDAIDIGLIPDLSQSKITQIKNGALEGACLILKDPKAMTMMNDNIERTQYVNLMDNPQFDELMSRLQMFRPIQ